MSPLRFYLFAATAGMVLIQPLRAQTPAPVVPPAPATPAMATPPPPWTPDKQFSADESITMKSGMSINGRMNVDNGKIRTAANMNGMDMVAIIRLDEKKMFTVMEAQKMVMEMTLSPDKVKQYEALTTGAGSNFLLVGPELLGTTPSFKYKMTTDKSNKAFFWWLNAATKVPVKMAAEDGSIVILMSNYKVGPQDAALFEPPAGYQVIEMPANMGGPGGGPGPGAPGATGGPGGGP